MEKMEKMSAEILFFFCFRANKYSQFDKYLGLGKLIEAYELELIKWKCKKTRFFQLS